MEELKELVEEVVEYTRTWTISETEWYWAIDCVRKPDNIKDKNITWEEFEIAIREEILYDLVYCKGCHLLNQMENDLCNYYEEDSDFQKASKNLEEKVQRIISDFKIERY